MQHTVGQRGGVTDIEDSPAIGALIALQTTVGQGAAAPSVDDAAPVLSSGVALQTTVGQRGGVVISIINSPATVVGPITGQGTTRQGAAAPRVEDAAPVGSSGVAGKECVGDNQLIGVVNTSAINCPVVTENTVRNRQPPRVLDAPTCTINDPACAIYSAIGNGKPVETDGGVGEDVENSEGSRTPAHGEVSGSRPQKRNVFINVGQRTR